MSPAHPHKKICIAQLPLLDHLQQQPLSVLLIVHQSTRANRQQSWSIDDVQMMLITCLITLVQQKNKPYPPLTPSPHPPNATCHYHYCWTVWSRTWCGESLKLHLVAVRTKFPRPLLFFQFFLHDRFKNSYWKRITLSYKEKQRSVAERFFLEIIESHFLSFKEICNLWQYHSFLNLLKAHYFFVQRKLRFVAKRFFSKTYWKRIAYHSKKAAICGRTV